MKFLWFDGDGLCLFCQASGERADSSGRRLRKELFALSRAQLSMLLEGIDWRRPQRTWTPEIAV